MRLESDLPNPDLASSFCMARAFPGIDPQSPAGGFVLEKFGIVFRPDEFPDETVQQAAGELAGLRQFHGIMRRALGPELKKTDRREFKAVADIAKAAVEARLKKSGHRLGEYVLAAVDGFSTLLEPPLQAR